MVARLDRHAFKGDELSKRRRDWQRRNFLSVEGGEVLLENLGDHHGIAPPVDDRVMKASGELEGLAVTHVHVKTDQRERRRIEAMDLVQPHPLTDAPGLLLRGMVADVLD